MIKDIKPVILCGGYGKRLWPLSRKNYPKQFLKIIDKKSLFQHTVLRVYSLRCNDVCFNEIILVGNEEHRFIILKQMHELNLPIKFCLIIEPVSKNTAPSLSLASLYISEKKKDFDLLVCPSDHFIGNEDVFKRVVIKSILKKNKDDIILYGIKPSKADTGYGYIITKNNGFHKKVSSFKEKPNRSLAQQLITNDGCYWNSGIFLLNSNLWLSTLKYNSSKMYELLKKSWNNKKIDNKFIRPDKEFFERISQNSIDYEIIENFNKLNLNVLSAQLRCKWNDLGSYSSLHSYFKKDKFGNSSTGNIYSVNSKNNMIINQKHKVFLNDIDNLIVAQVNDILFIARLDKPKSLNSFIIKVICDHPELLDDNYKVMRPWGWYEFYKFGTNFSIKHIYVNPKSSLSYQSHNFRNEHWVVINGSAEILLEGKYFSLKSNQSFYIQKKQKHKLINKNNKILEVIEIQTGSVLSEQDITRFQDEYGRVK